MLRYIHELAEWPRFTWQNEQLSTALAAVRYRQGRLFGQMSSLGFSLRTDAVFRTLTEDVIKSSQIEGESLNREQVRSSLARRMGVDIGALAPSDRNVDGVVEMMLDATQKAQLPLTKERLWGWHAALFPTGFSGLQRIVVGAWRDDSHGPMRVVSGPMGRERVHFEAPAAVRLEQEMQSFLEWFNRDSKEDPVLKAGLAHLWFVTLHPFADGNGRIARAVADMALARSEGSDQRFYSMSAQIQKEREKYYDMLESAQKGGLDVTAWLAWFLGCLERAFDGAEIVLATVLTKARFWERNAGQSFNERQRQIVNKLLDGFEGKLTTSKWAKLGKCSADTALRDIENLIERGVLKKEAAGGRSTSYSLVE